MTKEERRAIRTAQLTGILLAGLVMLLAIAAAKLVA